MIHLFFKYCTIKVHSNLLKLGRCIRFKLSQFVCNLYNMKLLNLAFKNLLYHSKVNDYAFEVISKMLGCFVVLLCSIGKTSKSFETTDVSAQRLWQEKNSKMRRTRQSGKRGNLLPELVAAPVSFRLQNFLIAAAIKRFNSAFGFF